jgi:hypothetical protein
VWDAVVFGLPVVLGAALGAAFARGFAKTYAVFGLGLLLGFGIVVAAYLSAPPDLRHAGGTEGEQFLGRTRELVKVLGHDVLRRRAS